MRATAPAHRVVVPEASLTRVRRAISMPPVCVCLRHLMLLCVASPALFSSHADAAPGSFDSPCLWLCACAYAYIRPQSRAKACDTASIRVRRADLAYAYDKGGAGVIAFGGATQALQTACARVRQPPQGQGLTSTPAVAVPDLASLLYLVLKPLPLACLRVSYTYSI